MKYSVPAIEEYEKLLPVARKIYEHTSHLSWQMLLPMFLVSVAVGYTTDLGISGAVLVRLKRLLIVALLLISFPTIAEFSQVLGVEVAKSIDDMTGIDAVLDAASKRADAYSFDLEGLLNLAAIYWSEAWCLSVFVILIVARFFLLAFQHFYWFLLVALGPFLILGTLFESSSGITRGLFKSMFQVACWPVVWSILSAFLKALPFASAYATEGNLITVVTLNLIIAIAMLFSPFIVSQLADGVQLSVGDTLRKGVYKTVMMTNPKGIVASAASRAGGTAKYANYARKFSKGGK
jgi:hypothetical protein